MSWLFALAVMADPARPVARVGEGEPIVEASAPARAPSRRRVHGHARLSLGFGSVAEDPTAFIEPSVALDLRAIAPVEIAFAIPFRIRAIDRSPEDPGTLRERDWDEVGDYFALIRHFAYADDFGVGRRAHLHVSTVAGVQRDVDLGHGSLVRGWANGLDIDRRRHGAQLDVTVSGALLDQPADAGVDLLAGDVAGSQILGARVRGRWAGAGLAATVVGDPTAPRELVVQGEAFEVGRGNRLRTVGARGVVATALELDYVATDRWRYSAGPYLDLDLVSGIGRGLHLGGRADGRLGRRRAVTLGGTAELTVGSAGYDPAYFDVFYLATRWHAPVGGRDDAAPTGAAPKASWVRDNVPRGVGGMGTVRFEHASGARARLEYRARPGTDGHVSSVVIGVDLPEVELFARFAHRGRHGFEPKAAGTLAQLELRVPVLRWLDVDAAAGWIFATRGGRDGNEGAVVRGAGIIMGGVAGRVPW